MRPISGPVGSPVPQVPPKGDAAPNPTPPTAPGPLPVLPMYRFRLPRMISIN